MKRLSVRELPFAEIPDLFPNINELEVTDAGPNRVTKGVGPGGSEIIAIAWGGDTILVVE